MTRNVLTASPNEQLDRAAQLMVERRVGSAVVVDGGRVAGIITERDVLRAVARGLVPWHTPVSECMTAAPLVVGPDTPAAEALELMITKGFRHLPVIEDGQLVGVVSLRDLVSQGVNA
jgi:CBS domain-containing protein